MNKNVIKIILGLALLVALYDLILVTKSVVDYERLGLTQYITTLIVSGIIRVCMYAIGFYLISQKRKWARTVLAVLFIFRSVSSILVLFMQVTVNNALSAVVFGGVCILLYSKTMNQYLNNTEKAPREDA